MFSYFLVAAELGGSTSAGTRALSRAQAKLTARQRVMERSRRVAPRKDVVETYFEGFRQGDHGKILGCLTDDITWNLPGYRHLTGKDQFDPSPTATGHPLP